VGKNSGRVKLKKPPGAPWGWEKNKAVAQENPKTPTGGSCRGKAPKVVNKAQVPKGGPLVGGKNPGAG